MVKNSGDTQARFLSQEPGFFSIQRSVFSTQPKKKFTRKARKEAQRNTNDKEVAADFAQMNADTGSQP